MKHLNTLRIKQQRTKHTVHILLASQLLSLTLEHPHIFTPIDPILNLSHPHLATSMVLVMERGELKGEVNFKSLPSYQRRVVLV